MLGCDKAQILINIIILFVEDIIRLIVRHIAVVHHKTESSKLDQQKIHQKNLLLACIQIHHHLLVRSDSE